MGEHRNTIVCTFDGDSIRISALEIHDWIHNILRIPEQKVNMIQIDGTKRQVYIKMTDNEGAQDKIQGTGGQAEYKHANGEISTVGINKAGIGTRRERIANFQPEVAGDTLRASLAQYGKILFVKEETWARIYRYAVANGIRQVETTLTKHIPSHITMAGH
jgi:hypothetical protein